MSSFSFTSHGEILRNEGGVQAGTPVLSTLAVSCRMANDVVAVTCMGPITSIRHLVFFFPQSSDGMDYPIQSPTGEAGQKPLTLVDCSLFLNYSDFQCVLHSLGTQMFIDNISLTAFLSFKALNFQKI